MVAALLRVPLIQPGPVFPVAAHSPTGAAVVGGAVLVGICAGLGSGLMTLLVYTFEDLFGKLPVHWMWWPALGAVAVGLGGMIDPRVLGVGYDTIHSLLRGEILGRALVALVIAKGLVWAIALGSGTSGGVLAPLLIMGGAIGGLLGPVLPAADQGLWAMIGMGAIISGTMRSPLTGIVFMLELTHDLNALPALLAGCVAALGLSVLLLRRSILTEKLARRGQHIAREYSVDVFELMRVGEVMDRQAPTVPASMRVSELSDLIARGDPTVCVRQGTLLVDEAGKLAGIITRGDVVRALRNGRRDTLTVLEAGKTDLVVTYADEPLNDAITKMLKHGIGRLPVVERRDATRVVGYLGRASLLAAQLRRQQEEEVREQGPRVRPREQPAEAVHQPS